MALNMGVDERVPPHLIVREATAADNGSLIALELQTPLLVGNVEEYYDRSPDFFACHRVQGDHRVVLADVDGRVIAVMAGVVQTPMIQGRARRLLYIQQARVHPEYHGRGVAWSLANDLFGWGRDGGTEGPYYLIAPENEPSVRFGGRAGRRWPAGVTLLEFDVRDAQAGRPEPVPHERLEEAVGLVNSTHAGEDFFEPLTVQSLTARLSRDGRYGFNDLYGIVKEGALAAVGGLWDRGAATERIQVDRVTGATTRSRAAAVVDWGWGAGRERAFVELLRGLAAEASALGRLALTICEPSPGAVPDPGFAGRRAVVALYTPALAPPPAEAIHGLYVDLLEV